MKPKKKPAPAIEAADRHSMYLAIGLLGVVFLLTAVARVRLLGVPLERDEGEYAYAGQLILHGIPPYQYAYNMKFPGTYGAYALIMAVFGQTAAGIRLGLLLVNAATIGLVYFLAKRLIGTFAAAAAASSFAIMSAGQPVMGTFAHATHFVIVFAAAGVLMLLAGLEKKRNSVVFGAGAMLGLALLMKQHAFFIAFFGFAYLCWKGYQERTAFRDVALRVALFSAGLVIPFGLTALLLLRAGVFGKFWFWTFTYASSYVTQVPLSMGVQSFFGKFGRIVGASPLLWLAVAGGVAVTCTTRSLKGKRGFLIGFTLSSFLAMVPGLYFREHYFILLLPAAAVLAGAAASWFRDILAKGGRSAAYRTMPILALAVALLTTLIIQREFLFEMSPLEASRSTYGRNPFPESVDVAAYIRAHTQPQDRVAVIGSEPQIYFYANRASATGYIYMYGLMEPQPHALEMQHEMINEVESAAPKFVVYVPVNESWLKQPGSETMIFDWAGGYIKDGFDLVGIAEMTTTGPAKVYWDAELAQSGKRAPPSILVYRKKGGTDE